MLVIIKYKWFPSCVLWHHRDIYAKPLSDASVMHSSLLPPTPPTVQAGSRVQAMITENRCELFNIYAISLTTSSSEEHSGKQE